jgi:hypothetical protein
MPDTYFSFVLGFVSLWTVLMVGFVYLWIRMKKVESKLQEKR